MWRKWYKLQNPEIFQGDLSDEAYFEGWYYKMVSEDQSTALAVIPGVSLADKNEKHAFIQVLDGIKGKSYYYSFDLSEFKAHKKKLEIQIGDNFFSTDEVVLNLPVLKGRIQISDQDYFPKSILSPGVMGWYSFMPFMQCYHGVVSMHHYLNGSIELNGIEKRIKNGIGYIEKDWGTSFPKSWIWIHSNHFRKEKVSLMASVAHIPWLGSYFIGFLVVLQTGNQIYRFATYTGAKMKAEMIDDRVNLSFKKGEKILSITAQPGKSASLKSPLSGKMTGKVNESLQATVDIELKEGGNTLLRDHGTTAGLEVAGPADILLTETWR